MTSHDATQLSIYLDSMDKWEGKFYEAVKDDRFTRAIEAAERHFQCYRHFSPFLRNVLKGKKSKKP